MCACVCLYVCARVCVRTRVRTCMHGICFDGKVSVHVDRNSWGSQVVSVPDSIHRNSRRTHLAAFVAEYY